MKTRRRSRGGTRKVRFNSKTKEGNSYESNQSTNHPNYLPNLLTAVRRYRPQPTDLHEHDAAILAAVMEAHNTPQEMFQHLKDIYEVVPLTENQYQIANTLYKKHGVSGAIDALLSAPLPPDSKEKILNYLRFVKVSKKMRQMFSKEIRSSQRYIHNEWGPNQANQDWI